MVCVFAWKGDSSAKIDGWGLIANCHINCRSCHIPYNKEAPVLIIRGFSMPIIRTFCGGDVGTRTPDPHTASVMLSQLSYTPIVADMAFSHAALGIIRYGPCNVKHESAPMAAF
jgi:hypothetical protein